jgi:predicted dehydrogenase
LIQLGLVGYGAGGRYFHAPFISAADGVELAGVVTRSPRRRAELAADFPGLPVFDSMADLIAHGVDAVTITTPPQTRRELVLEALAAGVAVIADKPFAPSAERGRELVAAADAAGLPLCVFHNRRWDADVRTLAAVLQAGSLGQVWHVHSRFDLDQPDTLETGPGGGLLRDLGAHLVDQLIWLLGPVQSVYAELDEVDRQVDGQSTRLDCGFRIALHHIDGVRSHVSSSKLNHFHERELRAYGSAGSYVARGTDVQAEAIFAGERPASSGSAWGYERPERWGHLRLAAGTSAVPSERGAYHDYYSQFAAAMRDEAPFPVPGGEAIHTLQVLDAARTSAVDGRVVAILDSSHAG